MKTTRAKLSVDYLAALRAHLGRRRSGSSVAAHSLGRTAVASGFATSDLAKIHEHAVLALAAIHDFARPRNRVVIQARWFFHQALTPVERAHRAVGEINRALIRRIETLRSHAAAVARGNGRLKREIARRQVDEVRVAEGKERYRTLFLESKAMQAKLRQLTHQIISVQEEERRKISRELHDEVVQTLVGINVELTALDQRAGVGIPKFRRKLARTRRLVENSVKAVHRFARELRPAVLDDIGLIPALHAYSENLATRYKLRIQLTAFARVEELSIGRRAVLFRVATEALDNVAHHAAATQVTLGLCERGGAVEMTIRDDGRSFAVAKTLRAPHNKRLGLIGMKERIEMIGGTFAIESVPGSGTTIRTTIPFPRKQSPDDRFEKDHRPAGRGPRHSAPGAARAA